MSNEIGIGVTDAPGTKTIPTVDSPSANILSAVIETGERANLTLDQASKLETVAGEYLAGSDMAVPQAVIDWAKQRIAEGKLPEFKARTTGQAQARRTGPNSQSKGKKAYLVMFVEANGVNGGKPFPTLKPRGTVAADTVVNVSVVETGAGWSYNVTL